MYLWNSLNVFPPLLLHPFSFFFLPPCLFLTPHPSNRALTPPSTTTPAPPPGPDNSNYIPLKYYRRRSYSTSLDCHVFMAIKTARPLLNIRALAWGILLSRFVEFRLSRSVMRERDCYLRRLSLCARCYTQWLSIIEWFCEGSMRLGIVFIPLSLWISSPFISALRNSTYSTLS